MVEINQFGSALPGSPQVCARCEALLIDILDGIASAEDQLFFDQHIAGCTGCSQMLDDARRGGAWLEMLRDPRPEPPAALFERILAQTSGLAIPDATPRELPATRWPADNQAISLHTSPSTTPSSTPQHAETWVRVLPFRVRGTVHRLSQTMLQPRLAMTAAMAFFSIALTLNLTGVRVGDLRLSDLRPANLRRDFYQANAHVVRYCDNLRVVYELEARAHELQRSSDVDGSTSGQGDGQTSAPPAPVGNDRQKDSPRPEPKSSPGTSSRQPLVQNSRTVATLDSGNSIFPHSIRPKGDQA